MPRLLMGEYKNQRRTIMRIVERLLYGIGGLLALILLFIMLCHFKPELAEKIGETLKANAKEMEEISEENTVPDIETSPRNQIDTFDAVTASDGMVVLPITREEYEAPTEDQLTVPSWAQEKSDLASVEAQGAAVTEQEARTAFDTLGIGNTGKDLSFDAVMYPYYHMLDATGKAIYRQIYANANSLVKEFAPVEATIAAETSPV